MLKRIESYEFPSLIKFSKNSYISCIYNSKERTFSQENLWLKNFSHNGKMNIKLQKDVSTSSKDYQAIRRITSTSEGWSIKKDLSKRVIFKKLICMKYLTLKSLLCMIHGSFLKVKLHKTGSKRSVDTLKNWWTQTASFLFYDVLTCWEEESNLLLSLVLD